MQPIAHVCTCGRGGMTREKRSGGGEQAEVTDCKITEGIKGRQCKNVRKGSEGAGTGLVLCM